MKRMRRLFRCVLRLGCLLAVVLAAGMLFVAWLLRLRSLRKARIYPRNPGLPPSNVQEPKKPEIDPDDWRLVLVNKWNALPEGFEPETVEIERGYRFDARAADKLTAMLDGCRAAGLHPLICSAYRTGDYQTSLFEKQVRKQKSKGLDGEKAGCSGGRSGRCAGHK